MGNYKLTERFTSRDGKMEPDPREYGMTQHGLDVVGDKRDELGGATMIFVRVDGGSTDEVTFFTRDNQYHFNRPPKPESGWSVYELTHDNAGYNPEKGEIGWWNAIVNCPPNDTSEFADNIGLPHSWHVSTFLVFTWQEENSGSPDDGDQGPEVPTPPDSQRQIVGYLYSDGTWEKKDG